MRPQLFTERLLLRDITADDAALLQELDSDPEVMRHIGPHPAGDIDCYRERIESVYIPWQAHTWQGIRLIHDGVEGTFLGWVFIRPAPAAPFAAEIGWVNPHEVEIGYRLRRSAWGRGIATEASWPLMHMAMADPSTAAVVACASSNNLASLRVLDKLGFERIGTVAVTTAPAPVVKCVRTKQSQALDPVKIGLNRLTSDDPRLE